ncbi:low affinity immunoglobulin gamma Fc region receptor II-a-like isoform X1 [Clarias gariepinus]|uniref:low affinity immunoglobulin gamma Fc region receptor II-a-like isoform X1 n=1 Tax=Clarias gariepinus TaxID=13013 RepID=UPI00234C0E0F|nr:low affinity immunoglobulin gamma Fc region receptor II-a-like isoform X1 [Clarias gariepinus]
MDEVLRLCVCVSLTLFITNEAVAVRRVFVPEDHFLVLSCDGQSDVKWRHGGDRLINVNSSKQKLFPDGTLYIDDVEMSDSGLYFCNDELMAHVTVLTDYNVVVCEGGTLYLRCTLPKQRWAFKNPTDPRREFISTRFKNGTVLKERPDPDSRFTHSLKHLQIQNLQQLDSGTYFCSGKDIAVVNVTSESDTLHCPAAETTESGSNVPHRPGNVVLVAVLALCVLAVVTVVLLLVIMCLKFSSRKKPTASKPEESERQQLQETHSQDADAVTRLSADRLRSGNDEIHYASLGRQNWKPRGWNQQSRQQVIYSTLLLTPKHTPTHTP